MQPNSQNQMWSKWVWFVQPERIVPRSLQEVKANCARFGRKAFGSASNMRVRKNSRGYLIELLTEGHPVHDPQFVKYMRDNWTSFFMSGFGLSTKVKMSAKLMAGSRQDGTPSDQLLIIPALTIPQGVNQNG